MNIEIGICAGYPEAEFWICDGMEARYSETTGAWRIVIPCRHRQVELWLILTPDTVDEMKDHGFIFDGEKQKNIKSRMGKILHGARSCLQDVTSTYSHRSLFVFTNY